MSRTERLQTSTRLSGGKAINSTYGKPIVDQAWEGHGATALIGLKDADLALEAAAAADLPLPSTHIWRGACQRIGEMSNDEI